MTTALAEDEILTEVRLPIIADQTRFGFVEFNRRAGDFAIVAALVTYRLADGVMAEARVGHRRRRGAPAADCRSRGRAARSPADDRDVPVGGRGSGRRRRSDRRHPVGCGIPPRSGSHHHASRAGACGRMSAPTKGSGTTWVGRSIRRLEDPALVRGQGHFTADLAGGALAAFRSKSDRLRPHHAHQVTARHKRVHRRRSSGREADQADAAQVQLHSGRATDPASGRRAVCRRADRRGRGPQQGGGRGYCRSRRDRD